jgi:hypothetical protein
MDSYRVAVSTATVAEVLPLALIALNLLVDVQF